MNVELSFRERGGGAPLVVLHGLFGSKRNWEGIAKALARDHHVVTADLRNHGESPWHDDVTYDALAEDVAALIKRRGLGACTVLGHSMGGKTAMTLALKHPNLVEALVVVDIAPAPTEGNFRPLIEAMAGVPLVECDGREDVDEVLAETIDDPSLRGFLLQNLRRGPDGLAWRINLRALHAGMADVAGFPDSQHGRSFLGPSLFLVGGASDYVRPSHHAAIRRLFPKARIEVVPGAGHWVHAQDPEGFLRGIRGFMAELP